MNLMNEKLWKENDPADSQDCQQVRLNLVAGARNRLYRRLC